MKFKKALIYSPYWDTLGGGERFAACVAEVLLKDGYRVTIAWKEAGLIDELKQRFNLDLQAAEVDDNCYRVLGGGKRWQKYQLMKEFDLVFWVSDGSVPFLFGKKNLVLFQIPFAKLKFPRLTQGFKQLFIHKSICYSQYVKEVIDPLYGIAATVLYPPVTPFASRDKDKIILSVGRFDNLLHAKRQDILIEAFKDGGFAGWKLVLAGGSLHGTLHLKELQDMIDGANIELVVNPTYTQLAELYGQARIYWHAAGYGQDLKTHPELAEHFGMTTVEAMSAGVVPLVFGAGGQKEIVKEEVNGYLWQTKDELIEKTKRLIDNSELFDRLAQNAKERSNDFSIKEFQHAFQSLIG